MKKFFEKLMPKYAYFPIFAVIASNLIIYFGSKLFVDTASAHNLAVAGIDDKIPFVPAFVFIYVIAFIQWVAGFIILSREDKAFYYRMMSSELIQKLICLVFFIALPTTIARPEVTGGGFVNFVLKIVYFFDTPMNLFPSIHVAESWFCFRCSLSLKKMPKWYAPFTFLLTAAVAASILFVKQHYFVDIIGGILVCELCVFLSGKIKLYKLFELFEKKFTKEEIK